MPNKKPYKVDDVDFFCQYCRQYKVIALKAPKQGKRACCLSCMSKKVK